MEEDSIPRRKARGRGASTPSSAPAPGSPLFTTEGLKAELLKQYESAVREATEQKQGRDRATFATLAARLLKDIGAIGQAERDAVQDKRMLEAADRLEELLTKGAGRAGGEDADPPFNAPETPAPH